MLAGVGMVSGNGQPYPIRQMALYARHTATGHARCSLKDTGFAAEHKNSSSYRRVTLISGNVRSATRVHFLVRPFLSFASFQETTDHTQVSKTVFHLGQLPSRTE